MSEGDIINSLNLGTSKAILENSPSSPLSKLLQELIQDVIEKLKASLVEHNVNTSSQGLSQSVKPTEVKIEGDSVEIGISMEFYWRYVNYGVNGTEVSHGAPDHGTAPAAEKSFHQSIVEWIPKRGLSLPEEFNSFESFSFAIMQNIKKHGKKARPFFDDVVNEQLTQTLREPIEALIGRAIQINIVAPWQ